MIKYDIPISFILGVISGILVMSYIKNHRPSIQIGDKGKEIEDFQSNLNKIVGVNFITDPGVYDRSTMDVVNDLFQGTHALIDSGTGKVDKNFVYDFNIILNKLK